MTELTRRFEEATGIASRVRNAEASGRPILLLHGAGGNKLAWLTLSRHLAENLPDRPIEFLDLPGHGESRLPGQRTIAGYAASLLEFLDARGMDRVDLVGHSMGGAIALTLALDFPDRVGKVAAVASGYRLSTAPMIVEAFVADREQALTYVREFSFSKGADENVVDAMLAGMRECDPDTLVNDFRATGEFDIHERVGALVPPLAVFVGEKDMLTSAGRNRALAEAVEGAQFKMYPGAGHMVTMERPRELARDLAEFLRDAAS
ncbi:alpha/beta fold hydrolase [bacterium]|nr:alpha/beta fold hydrolase [bacterium]